MHTSRLARFGDGLLCIGHRGARAFAPENTLPAIERAAQLGCNMVEIDVHLSRDGQPVVHHDDHLLRCTDVAQRFPDRPTAFVSDFSFEELRQLDAGSWYLRELALPAAQRQPFLRSLSDAEIAAHVGPVQQARFGGGQVQIPHLAQVLDLAQALGLAVNVEIKSIPRMYAGIAAKVVQEIQRAGMQARVLVSSFDHTQLQAVRSLDSTLPLGVLSSDRLAQPARYLQWLDADAYHPGCAGDVDTLGFGSVDGQLDPRSITELRANSLGVIVWTCNDSAQMRALAAAGVSGIITDYPNRWPR